MKDGENMQAVETDFITGDMNLKELSEAHDLDYEYLRQVACKKGWTKKREQYRSQLSHKQVTKTAERVADKFAERQELKSDICTEILLKIREKVQTEELSAGELNLLANATTKIDAVDSNNKQSESQYGEDFWEKLLRIENGNA